MAARHWQQQREKLLSETVYSYSWMWDIKWITFVTTVNYATQNYSLTKIPEMGKKQMGIGVCGCVCGHMCIHTAMFLKALFKVISWVFQQ